MTTLSSETIKRLPLHGRHVSNGARLGHFGEWEVPLYYSTIIEEHHSVRRQAGVFDISHMGEIWVSGSDAAAVLDKMLPRSILSMNEGKALYMPLLNERGGMVDDIIVYRWSQTEFLIIVNASNIQKDFAWLKQWIPSSVTFEDLSETKGLLALQGPNSEGIIRKIYGDAVASLRYYHFSKQGSGMIARTGYTGEDGFEIMVDKKELPAHWDKLFEVGKDFGLKPVGFGARDTLRLEAAMPLYGHDMNDDITPLELGIGWAVDFSKKDFLSSGILQKRKAEGIQKKLVCFEMIDKGIPRQDYEITKDGQVIGKVTSGSFSPTLEKNIGMGYVPVAQALAGNEIFIKIRDRDLKAKVVSSPFYKRQK